jgi:hypothetical protein
LKASKTGVVLKPGIIFEEGVSGMMSSIRGLSPLPPFNLDFFTTTQKR